MPHITARFIDGTPGLETYIRDHKFCIRAAVAEAIGYPLEEVAFYASREDPELTDNALPLEMLIDAGTRCLDKEDEYSESIKQTMLLRCEAARGYHFGIWFVSHARNSFVEHKPS